MFVSGFKVVGDLGLEDVLGVRFVQVLVQGLGLKFRGAFMVVGFGTAVPGLGVLL